MVVKRRGTDALPFREILRVMMHERGLSLQQVSQLAGVSKSVVQGWLNGATPHDLKAVAKLSKALGTSFKSLLLGEHEDSEKVQTIAELYDEVEFFDGLCRVAITKLVPRKQK